jgi:hypothetical protein
MDPTMHKRQLLPQQRERERDGSPGRREAIGLAGLGTAIGALHAGAPSLEHGHWGTAHWDVARQGGEMGEGLGPVR